MSYRREHRGVGLARVPADTADRVRCGPVADSYDRVARTRGRALYRGPETRIRCHGCQPHRGVTRSPRARSSTMAKAGPKRGTRGAVWLPVVIGMFRDRGLARSAVAAARPRPDSEGRAMPTWRAARGRPPRRFRAGAQACPRRWAACRSVRAVVAWAGFAATPAQAQGPQIRLRTCSTPGIAPNAAATSVGTGNVANLQLAWKSTSRPDTPGIDASPTVVGGVVYIGCSSGNFFAIREATRTVLWSRNFGVTPAAACKSREYRNRGRGQRPATGLTVYVDAPDGQLCAVSAATGRQLQLAVDTPSTTVDDYYASASPLVANGHVYVGISSQCDDPLRPAGVVEFDQDTGAPEGSWQTLPGGQAGRERLEQPGRIDVGRRFGLRGHRDGSTPQSMVRRSAHRPVALGLLGNRRAPPQTTTPTSTSPRYSLPTSAAEPRRWSARARTVGLHHAFRHGGTCTMARVAAADS